MRVKKQGEARYVIQDPNPPERLRQALRQLTLEHLRQLMGERHGGAGR